MKRIGQLLAILGVLLLLLSGGLSNAVAAPTPQPTFKHVCDTVVAPGYARCFAILRTDLAPQAVGPYVTPQGYGPADLESAYNLQSSPTGAGQTVAIVDAYDDPNAEADLAVYRKQFGLPACTTANRCFRKVGQNGGTHYPRPDRGWAQEIALDLDMVSAICPHCHILLVEAKNNNVANLGASVNIAASLGANVISNSYGGSESSNDPMYDTMYYKHPGIAITASTGDTGYGTQYPAASQYVTAVGGTSLSRAPNARGWQETVWSGAGSGCSQYDPKPSWQTDPNCSNRTIADIAAVADPSTGVAVYDSYQSDGWLVFGGTSASAPIIGSFYALGNSASTVYGSYSYKHITALNDVTQGSNGRCGGSYLCTGQPGYDGPTGNGTPNGVLGHDGRPGGIAVFFPVIKR